jgi:hypothetical protein
MIDQLREGMCNNKKSVLIVHNDLPANNFQVLFNTVHNKGVYQCGMYVLLYWWKIQPIFWQIMGT